MQLSTLSVAGYMQAHRALTDSRQGLPWEGGRLSPADREKLGVFWQPIMKLLQRDPCKRATARQFSEDVRNIFAPKPQRTFPGAATNFKPSKIALTSHPQQWNEHYPRPPEGKLGWPASLAWRELPL